jgi:hypothetical protein
VPAYRKLLINLVSAGQLFRQRELRASRSYSFGTTVIKHKIIEANLLPEKIERL